MNPILTVEFSAGDSDQEIKEESIPVHDHEEFLGFVAPGGGCENIPDEVNEIRIVFFPPAHRNTGNALADIPVTLQLGMVLFNGPLSEITTLSEQIMDKAGRGELSDAFLSVIGAAQ